MEQYMQINITFRFIRTLSFTLLGALALYACASGPKIFINEDPNTDFSKFKTYNFEAKLGTDDRPGYQSMLSGFLVNSVGNELETRGYVKADNPDLSVNFYLNTKEKIRTSTSSSSMGMRRGGYGVYGGYNTTVTQYTEGTLNIDLIDATSSNKYLVWEGIAVGKITDKVNENLEEVIRVGVADLFARYPYYAAGSMPPGNAKGNKK